MPSSLLSLYAPYCGHVQSSSGPLLSATERPHKLSIFWSMYLRLPDIGATFMTPCHFLPSCLDCKRFENQDFIAESLLCHIDWMSRVGSAAGYNWLSWTLEPLLPHFSSIWVVYIMWSIVKRCGRNGWGRWVRSSWSLIWFWVIGKDFRGLCFLARAGVYIVFSVPLSRSYCYLHGRKRIWLLMKTGQ